MPSRGKREIKEGMLVLKIEGDEQEKRDEIILY
jgi:hypothetical protein